MSFSNSNLKIINNCIFSLNGELSTSIFIQFGFYPSFLVQYFTIRDLYLIVESINQEKSKDFAHSISSS